MTDRTAPVRRSFWLAAVAAVTVLTIAACSGSAAATKAPASQTPASQPPVSQPPASPSAAASEAAMQVMGTGTFHDVDGSGSGTVQLAALPDGTYEIIFEDFSTTSLDHIHVVLVSNANVTASADVDKTKLLDLGALTAIEGMQEYKIPPDMAAGVMDGYHTVVIWDTEMAHAVAAAPLT